MKAFICIWSRPLRTLSWMPIYLTRFQFNFISFFNFLLFCLKTPIYFSHNPGCCWVHSRRVSNQVPRELRNYCTALYGYLSDWLCKMGGIPIAIQIQCRTDIKLSLSRIQTQVDSNVLIALILLVWPFEAKSWRNPIIANPGLWTKPPDIVMSVTNLESHCVS